MKTYLKSSVFVYFTLLGFAVNAVYFKYAFSVCYIVEVVGLAMMQALLFAAPIVQIKQTSLKRIGFVSIVGLYNVMILTDYFLMLYFNKVFDSITMELMLEANEEVTQDFFSTYFNLQTIFLVVGIVIYNVVCFWVSRKINLTKLWRCICAICMLLTILIPIGGIVMHKGTMMITQFCAPCRYYMGVTFYGSSELGGMGGAMEKSRQVKVERQTDEPINVVVVVGESYSKYRCSLYGYERTTAPNLQKRRDNGELIVYSDCVARYDATNQNMINIYSFSQGVEDHGEYPLFPACFKNAGFYCSLYDNQFIAQGNMVYNNPGVSDVLWDYRNPERMGDDMKLVNLVNLPKDKATLTVIHLDGQHYKYKNRYPERFQRFSARDITGEHSKVQKEIIANYDNATLYNDYVMEQIIRKYEKSNSVILYFSDHGEEVYELGDFMGHGTAATTSDMKYQLEVPFFIWTSRLYQEIHPDKIVQMKKASHYRITTSDVSHVLMDIADIRVDCYDAKRSFMSSSYDTLRHRLVLKDMMDYDEK